ncbi:hypothetical protein [Geobacillus subterraneus]|uniref:Lipoprotein n=1 Tax=Geobacillus subterraneus TaxID=129338 RepID=A0A679FQE9_9BACL|nr:hypothetical protein [Geobacillus subterraneus]BBW98882.1 hypothetical protein GsuE55_37150 [Geobacillus subterraneus]
MQKSWKPLWLGVCLSLLLLSACQRAFSPKEENAFMERYVNQVKQATDVVALEEELTENLDRLSKENQSHAVDAYLFALHQEAERMAKKMSGLTDLLKEYQAEGVIQGTHIQLKKVKDETLSAFLRELQKKHLVLDSDEGGYRVYPDLDYVYERYHAHMDGALKDLVRFVKEENKHPVIKGDGTVDLGATANRIIQLESLIQKHRHSPHKSSFVQSLRYYYETYFGLNNEYVIQNNVVSAEAYQHYQKTVRAHEGTQLAKDLQRYLARLNASHRNVTDATYDFLFSLVDQKLALADVKKETLPKK